MSDRSEFASGPGTNLDLGVGLLGVNETSGVDLDLLHVDGVCAEGEGHLDTVTGRVVAVGGGQVVDVGAAKRTKSAARPKKECTKE